MPYTIKNWSSLSELNDAIQKLQSLWIKKTVIFFDSINKSRLIWDTWIDINKTNYLKTILWIPCFNLIMWEIPFWFPIFDYDIVIIMKWNTITEFDVLNKKIIWHS